MKKLLLPAVIIIASLILGSFYYATQINKQESIERQQMIKLQEDRRQQEIENALQDLKLKQDECKALSIGVIEKWDNVMGVTYDNEIWKECVVTYTDLETSEIVTFPLRLMKRVK